MIIFYFVLAAYYCFEFFDINVYEQFLRVFAGETDVFVVSVEVDSHHFADINLAEWVVDPAVLIPPVNLHIFVFLNIPSQHKIPPILGTKNHDTNLELPIFGRIPFKLNRLSFLNKK